MYNCDEEDLTKIINDNINNTTLKRKATNIIKKNKEELLLINIYINSKKSNILIFIEEEKPLIIPTKDEKNFFLNFYYDIYYNKSNASPNIEEICKKYKDILVQRKILFGKKISNLEKDKNKNRNIYFSFINQGINCLFENNIISKNSSKDYYFILGYLLLYAYFFEENAYIHFLNSFNTNIAKAAKEKYSYSDLMKIAISFTIFYINELKPLDIEFIYKYKKDSPFTKGFEFFKNIINELEKDSDLTFIYLQINSGSGLDLITNNKCYKLSMISVEDIKSHIIENIPKYFYVFYLNNDIYISTDARTQVMSFNTKNLFEHTGNKSVENNTMNVTLGMFHETGHAKFHKNVEIGGDRFPKYCVNKSFDLIRKLNWKDGSRGETGKFVDYFLYNSFDYAPYIIFTTSRSNELMNKNLFTHSLDELNNAAGEIIRNNNSNINIQGNHTNTGLNNLSNLSSGFKIENDNNDNNERYKSLEAIGSDICF